MEVIIQGAVSALGYLEEGEYFPEPDCYETLRDLIRYLRNDDDTWRARRAIGERNLVENDLIPLMKKTHEEDRMFDIVLRLMVNIVQPSIISTMGKMPDDQRNLKFVYELEDNLQKAKLAFSDAEFFGILKLRMEKYFMNTEWEDRSEEDRLVMERIIVLLRYVLSISHLRHDEKRTALQSNSHDRVTAALFEAGIHQVLIFIASQTQEKDFHLPVMEIVAFIVKEHNPEDIAEAGGARSEEEKQKAESELRQAFENEQSRIAEVKRKMLSSRHSRFAGSYWVDGLKTFNKESKFVTNKPVSDTSKISFLDERKKKRRQVHTRRVFDVKQETHLSSLELRVKIKDFCETFLQRAFNRLMKSTKQLAFGLRRTLAQRNADMHYFLLMRFFMKFARLAKMSPDTVTSCVGVEAFHHVQLQIDQYLENANLQKSEGKIHGMKAQYAVSAYKELILFHQHLIDHGSLEEKETARAACKHIMSVEEYRELGISILKKFKPAFCSKTFLRELLLATHYYFRMLEKSVKSGELQSVLTRQRKKKALKKKKTADTDAKPTKSVCDSFEEERLDLIWARICEDLSDVVMGHEEASDDQLPMSNMLDCTDEDHQRFAMLRIQRALRERRTADAVGLYRSARDIWLIEEVFGKADMAPEEEFVELREIFYTDLSEVADSLLLAEMNSDARFRSNEMFDDEYGSDDEEDEASYETKEISFDFKDYIGRFAAADVVKWYVFLLADFDRNSLELNKALVKMLHRIAFDLNMSVRLYQLSLFRIFQRVGERMSTVASAERKKHSLFELYTFGLHLMKRFFKRLAEVGEKMAPETLFWKGAKESYELEFGYGSFKESKEEAKMLWSENLEDQLRSLYDEWKDMDERPSGMDVLDFIEANLDRPRTRHQISRKMKELGLDTLGAKTKGSTSDRNFPLIAMKELIDRFHEMDDNSNFDLVDWLRTALDERGAGAFTRQKIIKQLTYAGVTYEKKQKAKKPPKLPKWPEELVEELSSLKVQFEEDEDKGDVGLTDYVIRRLSKPKQRRQVELHLVALGADVPVTEAVPRAKKSESGKSRKSRTRGSDDEEEEEPGELSDNEEEEKSFGEDEESDAPLVDSDDEEGDMGIRLSKKVFAVVEDEENTMENREKSPKQSQKRKKMIDLSDDEEEEGERELTETKARSESPASQPSEPLSQKTKKRKRLVSSDESDMEAEEPAVVSSSQPSADGAQSSRKARRVVFDSDED